MDYITIILSIISIFGTASSILFAFLAFKRTKKEDHKQEGKNEGVLISDIGYIKSSIERIEKTLEKLEEKYDDLLTRLIKAEQKIDDHIKNQNIHLNLGGSVNERDST
ncbi:MAG: hypothetical protein H6687_02875 [Bacillales bacterium]|nr:hypothetical protein [Bacillales bacterium]